VHFNLSFQRNLTDHIGGFSVGQAYDAYYTPYGLVRDSIDGGTSVIYVAINYRVSSEFPFQALS
jgi:hypothetical protein